MALEQKLHLRLAQKLVMTPTLQQAIKLLQLSRLELERELSQEVQANPLLEMVEETPAEDEASTQTSEPGREDESGGGDELPGRATTAETVSDDEAERANESDPYSQVEIEALFSNYLRGRGSASGTPALRVHRLQQPRRVLRDSRRRPEGADRARCRSLGPASGGSRPAAPG